MDRETSLAILQRIKAAREKRGDAPEAFANAVQDMAASQLRADSLKDVRNIGLATLGIGAAGRGLVGLAQLLTRNKPRKPRSGPASLSLPYPVKAGFDARGFLGGDNAATKSGVPWYGPAMMLSGLAGLGIGWKGMDHVLDSRRKAETQADLDNARKDFRAALLSQYTSGKTAEDSPMVKASEALDTAFEKFAGLLEAVDKAPPPLVKTSVDWANLGGQAVGGYGMYAGLSGLLAGSLIYDKIKKRSRSAIINKALQRRQRREFMQQPTELYATPEPVAAAGG